MASNCGRYAEEDEDWAGKYGECWVHICRGPSDPVAAAVWSQRDDDGAPAVDGPSNEYVEELSSVQAFPLNGSLNDRNTQAYGKLYEIPNFNNNNDSSNNNNLAVRQHEHIIILMLISASQPVSPPASLTQSKRTTIWGKWWWMVVVAVAVADGKWEMWVAGKAASSSLLAG